MIADVPPRDVRSRSASTDVVSFFERHADRFWYYGSGKAALRDGLAALRARTGGENVLLPAYVPDAVVEPIRELGLEVRHYAVTPALEPDLADLEARLDGDTLAALSVDYFGFPQPGLGSFTALLEDGNCYHVEDAAHAGLSLDPADGTLLGTRGHVGIASLRKLLPIPNGAVLYLTAESVADRFAPSTLAEPKTRLDAADCRFVLESLATAFLANHPTIAGAFAAALPGGDDPGPTARYEASKSRLSALSRRVLDSASPGVIVASRRETYRRWLSVFAASEGAAPLFSSLPPGICPHAFPVRASAPTALRQALERWGVDGVYAWPRLPAAVAEDPAYETSRRLSREVLALPVHRGVDPATIETVGRRLRER